MSNTKRTITVTVPARHETTRWTDETFIEFGQYKERRPMTRTTTVETGPVLVEIDVAQIAAEIDPLLLPARLAPGDEALLRPVAAAVGGHLDVA